MIIILKTLFLSLIQSLTEFLPISSTAHLLLFSQIVKFNINDGNLFNTIIQLASSLSVIYFYRKKIFYLIKNFFFDCDSREFCYKLCLATIPSIIIGMLFYKIIKNYLYSTTVISISLIIGGLLILYVEKKQKNISNDNKITYKKSFFIGLFQSIAVIPGASRSGMTIIGGLLNKLSRKDAVEFSFFMSIPVMFLASCFDLYKNYENLNSNNIYILLIGFVSTFLFTVPIVGWFIKFISNRDFKIFAYYRIIFGILLLIFCRFYV